MQSAKVLASLFEQTPRQWGMRGDLYLWQEMRSTLGSNIYPPTEEQLIALLEQTYEQLTGSPLTNLTPIFVERYNHGGMSGGVVSPQFWIETAIPMLRARYRDTQHQ